MRQRLHILLVATLVGCGPSGPTKDGPDDGEDAPTSPVQLVEWYDGTVSLAGESEFDMDIRFVAQGDHRAVMRVGAFDPAWGYAAEFRIDGDRVLVDTGEPQGSTREDWDALSLEGFADGDVLVFDEIIARGGGELPFDTLRMVPHDGVKPVLSPQIDFEYDPAPVAGVYVGSVFALGVMAGLCTIELEADPLRLAGFDCNEVALDGTSTVRWDEERSLLNIVGDDTILVAELSALHDGELEGVLAKRVPGDEVIGPDDVPFDALIGLISLREDGVR